MCRFLLAVSLVLCPIVACAQAGRAVASVVASDAQVESERRPRIGIALEGGGALGLAHIGVLEWFEEHHIPVDYVAGTSMGGLVGGFYASGVTPAELRKIIAGVDWPAMLSGSIDYEDLSFRRKEDRRAYPNALLLGLRNGLSLPGGLNAGHQIGLLIDRHTFPYHDLDNFDQLPIPFRCVATDLVSGKAHVFSQGELSEALRATMSIPGVFTPVREGDKVLVDGGLVNNLPTDVVRQMGADVVIAVHLETQPAEAKDLQSIFGVLQQSVRIVISESEQRGMAAADAVVSIPLREFDASDYLKNQVIMQRGYETAEAKAAVLLNFAVDDSAWQQYRKAREARVHTARPTPQFLRVDGATGVRAESITRFLKPFVGKPLDSEKLDRALSRLAGVGRYEAVGYRIETQAGAEGLYIVVQEKPYAPPFLQPGGEVDGSEGGDVSLSLASRLTFLDPAGFRSEWRTDFEAGSVYGISSELYRPFTGTSKWFFAPRAEASDSNFQIHRKNDPLALYRIYRADIAGDLGYGFNRFTEIRLGYEYGYANAQLRLGTPEFVATKGRVSATRLRFETDHTDNPVVPRSGYRIGSSFRWVDHNPAATTDFPSLSARVQLFEEISANGSLFETAEGGSTLGAKNTGIPQFFLGAPLRLSAYGQNELFGNQYYLFQVGYLHSIFSLPPFVGKKVYVIGTYEAAKMYDFPNSSAFPNDFAAGVLAETVLGPFFVGGSIGDSGHHKWFFQLGRVF